MGQVFNTWVCNAIPVAITFLLSTLISDVMATRPTHGSFHQMAFGDAHLASRCIADDFERSAPCSRLRRGLRRIIGRHGRLFRAWLSRLIFVAHGTPVERLMGASMRLHGVGARSVHYERLCRRFRTQPHISASLPRKRGSSNRQIRPVRRVGGCCAL
jgi:hypothetical protein